ncbi:MAG TPA: protein singed [Scandinavium sp.]
MITYVTVADVDEVLGNDWAAQDDKQKYVLMANAWMNALNLQGIDPDDIPEEVKIAGAYVAKSAADGTLYEQKTSSGILASESVEAKGVKSSESYYTGGYISSESLLDPDLQFALDMLAPYRSNPLKFTVYR